MYIYFYFQIRVNFNCICVFISKFKFVLKCLCAFTLTCKISRTLTFTSIFTSCICSYSYLNVISMHFYIKIYVHTYTYTNTHVYAHVSTFTKCFTIRMHPFYFFRYFSSLPSSIHSSCNEKQIDHVCFWFSSFNWTRILMRSKIEKFQKVDPWHLFTSSHLSKSKPGTIPAIHDMWGLYARFMCRDVCLICRISIDDHTI